MAGLTYLHLEPRDEAFRANVRPGATPAAQERVYDQVPVRRTNFVTTWKDREDPMLALIAAERERLAAREREVRREQPPEPALVLRFAGDLVRRTGLHAYPKKGERFIAPKRRLPDVQKGR